MKEPGWAVEPISRRFDRASFDCGVESLNRFLQTIALQRQERDLGRTFVLHRVGDHRIYGYYTLANGIETGPAFPGKKLPDTVPITLLGRLAIDQSLQGQGFGAGMLWDALAKAARAADQSGSHAVVVDALDDQAASFYARHGFLPIHGQPLRLFLPMGTIRQVLAEHPATNP